MTNNETNSETNSAAIATLNNLITTCRDGQEGFAAAAEGVQSSGLKSLFYEYSQQRAGFVGALQTEARVLGGDPENTGSVAGVLHRGWINIKSIVTGSDEAAIVNECEQGEDSAVAQYQEALKATLPSPLAELLASQYADIKKAHDRIRAMQRSLSKTA